MVLGVLCATTSGATMVFPGEGFDAADTLKTLAHHRCTALHGVPTMFIAMLEDPGFAQHDLSSLRTGIMAGAPCPIETMRKVIAKMHMHQVTIAYGMTETSPISFQSSLDDPLERRVSTVGRVQPHLEVKIVDAQGRIVPVGPAGRAVHARLFGDARLLGRRGAHARVDRRRRLDAQSATWRPSTRRATPTSSAA